MTVSMIFAKGLIAEMRRAGLDSDVLLRRAGLIDAPLCDLRATIALDEAIRLADAAVEMTGDPGLGLTVGATAPESMLQILGMLLLSESKIRDAVATLARFSSLFSDGARYDLVERDGVAEFRFVPATQSGDFTRMAVDYCLSMAARIGKHFAAVDFGLTAVRVQHARPIYASRYEEVFGCQIAFEQEYNSIFFPAACLDRKQAHADTTVRRALLVAVERLLSERAQLGKVSQRVRTVLRDERDLSTVIPARLASSLGMSLRTMRRRLADEGTSISCLIKEARRTLAFRELRRPDLNIKETSAALGFSEPSAFHRAFKRWTGVTPLKFSRLDEMELSLVTAPRDPHKQTKRSPRKDDSNA